MRIGILLLLFFCWPLFAMDNKEMLEQRRSWLEARGLLNSSDNYQHLNSLIHADSPYLLSHALQPIDWIQWQSQYTDDLPSENKLVFISIGYDTCHWCHVMAIESFSNIDVAKVLNTSFVSIKVDREQWPQLDSHFKQAMEQLKGSAGWPLNIVLLPSGKMIWIDSYLPKVKLVKTLKALAKRWETKPKAFIQLADGIEKQISPLVEQASKMSTKEWIAKLDVVQTHVSRSLKEEGAGGQGPRFLRETWMLGLLEDYMRSGDESLLQIVEQHIQRVLLSPTYDPVEGGFHRYAVDSQWQRPHFEKMLYTQAQMIRVLAKLYGLTGKEQYLVVLEQTVSWTKAWLKGPVGYGSAVSALSEGMEGKYYRSAPLDTEETPIVSQPSIVKWNEKSLVSLTNLDSDWRDSPVIKRIRLARGEKIRPMIDTKAIVSWNSLYLISLVEAFQVTDDMSLLHEARQLSSSLWESQVFSKGVFRISFNGRVSIPAQWEDLAWFALAQFKLAFYHPWKVEVSSINDGVFSLSPKVKGKWLLGRLVEDFKLSQAMKLRQDGELPSDYGAVYRAMKLGYTLLSDKAFRDIVRVLQENHGVSEPELMKDYSFSSNIKNTYLPIHFESSWFARGHGKASVKLHRDQIRIMLDLEPGWHVNANPTNSDRLIPTQVVLLPRPKDETKFTVTYPKASLRMLTIYDEPIALYKGKANIIVNGVNLHKTVKSIELKVQACSDTMCLLPETLRLVPIINKYES